MLCLYTAQRKWLSNKSVQNLYLPERWSMFEVNQKHPVDPFYGTTRSIPKKLLTGLKRVKSLSCRPAKTKSNRMQSQDSLSFLFIKLKVHVHMTFTNATALHIQQLPCLSTRPQTPGPSGNEQWRFILYLLSERTWSPTNDPMFFNIPWRSHSNPQGPSKNRW